ncbi:helix-turn-helix domain-containing protein [Chryseobacterium turcicum]|uniref:Helix-turn-helix domain-containing protein n=1 Tax=Chryseobacterium turcicum TaxID=2898076 RepID=A0A9Q3V5L7_9FLAO|nr:helix-turn-helix transcriptional regulator [Chryseobacterium turcicum]MCD1117544.1 helix-turn-helix domain-containing protein [Chryseobacterium turcicum]
MQDKEIRNSKNALVNKHLCNYIEGKFLREYRNQQGEILSQNEYAKLCGITSSTISKLKLPEGYNIPMSTIYNILRHEQYSLERFFKEFENSKGINIPD